MFSRSRANTAICARFAASATSVKSRRKTSVEGVVVCRGGGGGAILSVEDVRVDANDEGCELDIVGDEIGAFILNRLKGRKRERGCLLIAPEGVG